MDKDLRRDLVLSLAILTVVTLITAWFSSTHYFVDEHYQILELMGYKLGLTASSDMRWEFHAQVRPWFQPLVYYAISRPLILLGVTDIFTVTFILRLLTGLLSLTALTLFARAILPTIEGEAEKRAFVQYLPLFGFLPYLFVRTSSETFSAAFFALGLAVALERRTAARLALAGLCCGLAFESRYQTGLMGLGLFAWLAVIAREKPARLAAFLGGGMAAVLLGALADRWGYGAWAFPPLGYTNVNLVQGVAAQRFGREPLFAYFWLMPASVFFAITLVLMAGMAAMWLRNARHPVSWASLPFVLAHLVIAHKEARFLFPLAILATSFPVLGFSPRLPRWRAAFACFWQWRTSWAALAVTAISVVAMAGFAVYPFGVRPHLPLAQYLYRHGPRTLVSLEPSFEPYPLFRRPGFVIKRIDEAGLAAMLEQGPATLITGRPVPPALPPGTRAALLYSEFPFARFGHGQWGADYIAGYEAFSARHRFLRLIPLHWYTLYRVERSATIRS